MECKHVQELLPLYVGRDLDEKLSKLVTAHVQSCAECAHSVDEYRESQELLQLFEPPPFSDAVYAGIRQRVLREIGNESNALTLPQLVARLFRPRIRWAVATALLLLAVSVVAFYFISNRRSDQQQVADIGAPSHVNESVTSPSPSSKQGDETPLANTGGITGADTTISGSANPAYQTQRKKSRGAAAGRARSILANTPDRSMTAKTSLDNNNLAEPNAVPARAPATSEKTLRVEMQTKDPNIRIIWISNHRTKQDSLK